MINRAIIFDLDGTLLDSLDDLADACNSVLKQKRFPIHPIESYKTFVGGGLLSLMQRIVPSGTDEDTIHACCSDFSEVYKKCWHAKSKPYDGITKMLSDLVSENVKLGILSNKPDAFTQVIAEHYFSDVPLLYIAGQKNEIPKKPDPAGAIYAANILDTPIENTFFIGDSAVDIQTGRRAGMKTIGVTWGFRSEEELRANKADKIVHSPKEIIDYVRITS